MVLSMHPTSVTIHTPACPSELPQVGLGCLDLYLSRTWKLRGGQNPAMDTILSSVSRLVFAGGDFDGCKPINTCSCPSPNRVAFVMQNQEREDKLEEKSKGLSRVAESIYRTKSCKVRSRKRRKKPPVLESCFSCWRLWRKCGTMRAREPRNSETHLLLFRH